ncbi:MAG: S9 family peptidase, partial [Acidobacteria bacterium]|nr:S9 family peptidase [Acidobacteriota bacterium]
MKRPWIPGAMLLLLLILTAACGEDTGPQLTYPETRKVDQVDDYFGTKVADPYRWMENEGDPDLRAWIDAQNKVTFDYLAQIPYRDKIRQRLEQVYDYPKYGLPERVGEYYFFTKNDGLQNQSVIYIRKGLDGEPEVFLDPNKMSPDGTTRVRLLDASTDDRYIAYSVSEGGSDWLELRVIEIDTRQELSDRIRWAKFTGVAWHDAGFFYSGFDQPEPGKELVAKNEYQKIFYHSLGQPQADDRLVYEDRAHPLRYKNVDVTEDGRWLVLSVSEGTHGNELYCRDLTQADSDFRPLITGFEHDSNVLDSVGDGLLILTNMDAPNQRIVRVDPRRPAPENWTVVVPEKPETITYAGTAAGQLFVHYLKDATSRVFQFGPDGTPVREVTFPAPGSVYGFGGHQDDDVLFYQFASFTIPPTIYRYDPRTGEAVVYQTTEVNFDPDLFETRQVFYT